MARSPTSREQQRRRREHDGEEERDEPHDALELGELTERNERGEGLQRIYARVMKWLSRRGLLRDPDASDAPREVAVTTTGIV